MSAITRTVGVTLGGAAVLAGLMAQSPASAATTSASEAESQQRATAAPCGHIWQDTGSLYHHCGSGSVIVYHRPLGMANPYRSVCLPPGISELPAGTAHAYSDGEPC